MFSQQTSPLPVLTSGADNITAEVTGPTCTPAHLHTAQDSELLLPSPCPVLLW